MKTVLIRFDRRNKMVINNNDTDTQANVSVLLWDHCQYHTPAAIQECHFYIYPCSSKILQTMKPSQKSDHPKA